MEREAPLHTATACRGESDITDMVQPVRLAWQPEPESRRLVVCLALLSLKMIIHH